MGLNRRKLKDWVIRRLLTEPKAASFALFHVGSLGHSKVCDLPAGVGSPEDWSATVERCVGEESREHIEAYPGRQQYLVRAFGATGDQQAEHAFWLTAKGSRASADLALQTPELDASHAHVIDPQRVPEVSHTVTMVMIQQMRHNETLTRTMVDMATQHAERDADIIKGLQLSNDRMEQRRLETMELLEALTSRKQERDILHDVHVSHEKRQERLLGKLEDVVFPAIMRSAIVKGLLNNDGKDGGVGSDVSDEIKLLFLKLPEAIQNQVITELGEEDAHRLMDLFARGSKERKPKEAKH